jgi:hypothetical protein
MKPRADAASDFRLTANRAQGHRAEPTPAVASRTADELRRYGRVPLSVPVRLRWVGAWGWGAEISETMDIGRGGLLVASGEARCPGAPVWVTFPFQPQDPQPVPEFAAHVAHARSNPAGGVWVGLAFAPSGCPQSGRGAVPRGSLWRRARAAFGRLGNGRRYERMPLALPISIHRPQFPWPEETVSENISAGGLVFCTVQVYEPLEIIEIELPSGRWPAVGRHAARVLRVWPRADNSRLADVAAKFLPSGTSLAEPSAPSSTVVRGNSEGMLTGARKP